ncbi:sulfite exporter TauE/SafE family protein [Actinoplanes bogorensis]|uniref:Probable membrane transporter protein n=1 Tax=Paractinoplanes bogorensis TaxID=1610840 RepID=A0ABS5YNN3_9ACTN|nr:sulfite exporter TauE/SafE family protein [Actinoplanes bogorensis]MBU2665064.1 sulfite exporter TauE/SafE family protein [Actinoplanes bogorensis]
MELWQVFALLGGGLAAGTVNAVAGGGSLITFPLLVGLGLPGVAANVSNALSVAPGYAASAVASRPDLGGQKRRIWSIVPTIVVGTLCGSSLLLFTPRSVFDVVVPFLLLLAAAMMAFQDRLKALAGSRVTAGSTTYVQVTVFLCGLYGGYFNAAMGLLLIAALSLVLDESLRRISALKNVFSAVVGTTTVLTYSIFGPVNWAVVAVLVPATIVGGVIGARIARKLPSEVLRWTIVVFALAVAIVLFVT